MSVSASTHNQTLTITVSGVLNSTLQKDFKETYHDIAMEMKEFIIDLQKTDFVDSSGLGLLLILHGKTKASPLKPSLKIINSKPNIAEILRICRFDQYFEIH